MNRTKRLLLFRHAKALPAEAGADDHGRALAPSGVDAAERMGRHIGALGLEPDLVLCSTSRRTVDTIDNAARAFPRPPRVEQDRGLYLCGPDALLRRVRTVDSAVKTLMIVAHNPDLHELAISLAAEGEPRALAGMRSRFPPGAFAALSFDAEQWSAVGPGSGTLDDYAVPNDL